MIGTSKLLTMDKVQDIFFLSMYLKVLHRPGPNIAQTASKNNNQHHETYK